MTIDKEIIYLESRVDDVERELHFLTHRQNELESRRKTLLEKINKLYDEDEEDKKDGANK
jgi:predicted transcriptional regulator